MFRNNPAYLHNGTQSIYIIRSADFHWNDFCVGVFSERASPAARVCRRVPQGGRSGDDGGQTLVSRLRSALALFSRARVRRTGDRRGVWVTVDADASPIIPTSISTYPSSEAFFRRQSITADSGPSARRATRRPIQPVPGKRRRGRRRIKLYIFYIH